MTDGHKCFNSVSQFQLVSLLGLVEISYQIPWITFIFNKSTSATTLLVNFIWCQFWACRNIHQIHWITLMLIACWHVFKKSTAQEIIMLHVFIYMIEIEVYKFSTFLHESRKTQVPPWYEVTAKAQIRIYMGDANANSSFLTSYNLDACIELQRLINDAWKWWSKHKLKYKCVLMMQLHLKIV